MNGKMTPSEVKALLKNNLILKDQNLAEEYVEIEIPNWIITILQILFPNWSVEKSIEYICQKFVDEHKHSKLN